ncbi:MAG: DNA mismatch repair endonuclease MutL [Verrucomicrobia bacterium]|jgi:DNA mismatch repair protein MutL|nr:DNA mismatch repair endonuclease MutL [Verrucomicrobiota bacterium]
MKRVQLLPDHVANQIAAGEVVERPASVVKELVENAIDAGSKRITVEIDAGGRSLIRVTDDGIGMNRDDALMCLERHATSKIREATDLEDIHTMGFRGEALPSIASVSRFTLTTRERDDASGEATRIVIQGGKMSHVEAAPSPSGTCIEVRQLFFNMPARKKFLKTKETEKSHIQQYLTLALLAHPQIGFKFVQDQRTVFHLNPVEMDESPESKMKALQERLRFLYAEDVRLLPVQFEDTIQTKVRGEDKDYFEENPVHIWGFTGAPGVARSSRADQYLFVNQRPIENRALNFALMEAYHTALMKGKYPVCCLFFELSPAFVDVNVHPAKKEVRFHNEYAVKQCAVRAVKRALLQFSMGSAPTPNQAVAPPVEISNDAEDVVPVSPGTTTYPAPGTDRSSDVPPPRSEVMSLPTFENLAPVQNKRKQTPSTGTAATPHGIWESHVHTADHPPQPVSTQGTPPSAPVHQPSNIGAPTPLLAIPMRIIGVLGKLYVLLESDRGLVLLDQHAAHERILFEKMLRQLETGEAPSQRLLLAETIELSHKDALFLHKVIEKLQKLGVEVREFGENTFILDALPPFVKAKDTRQYMLDVIDALKESGEVNKLRLGEDVIAKTVCRHAVKANDILRGPELEKLIEDLKACGMPYTCPHGRPTLIEMTFGELEKKFGRIQG